MSTFNKDPFFRVPMVESRSESDMCYSMILAALHYNGPKKHEFVGDALRLSIELRVDGVLEDLIRILKWDRSGYRKGEIDMAEFCLVSCERLLSTLEPYITGKSTDTDIPLSTVGKFMWDAYDLASVALTHLHNQRLEQKAIDAKTKLLPPKDLA